MGGPENFTGADEGQGVTVPLVSGAKRVPVGLIEYFAFGAPPRPWKFANEQQPAPTSFITRLADRFIARITRRPPDFIIGGTERPYIRRWWVIPRNKLFNVYLHCFHRSDDDRAHHDHPWLFNFSLNLRGDLTEETIAKGGLVHREVRHAGQWKFRPGPSPHRLELAEGTTCWTLFITGPRCREWGFHCPGQGWIHWQRFTAADDPGAVGPGCEA